MAIRESQKNQLGAYSGSGIHISIKYNPDRKAIGLWLGKGEKSKLILEDPEIHDSGDEGCVKVIKKGLEKALDEIRIQSERWVKD